MIKGQAAGADPDIFIREGEGAIVTCIINKYDFYYHYPISIQLEAEGGAPLAPLLIHRQGKCVLKLPLTPQKNGRYELSTVYTFLFYSVNVSPYTLDKLVSRSVTPAGSCTASSTESSLMARCPATRPSEVAMTRSTPSSARPAPANTCPGPSSSILSQLSSVSLYFRLNYKKNVKKNSKVFTCIGFYLERLI